MSVKITGGAYKGCEGTVVKETEKKVLVKICSSPPRATIKLAGRTEIYINKNKMEEKTSVRQEKKEGHNEAVQRY
jgi:hypothetical protein